MQMRGVRAQFAVHLWANRRGYCDWCHPDICKSSSCLSQETACDIMLLQMSPECAGRSHVTCRDLERSGARLGPRSANSWILQHWASVVLSIFVQYALRTFWLLIFPICLVEHDWPGLLGWRATWSGWPLCGRMVGSQGANMELSGASSSLTLIGYKSAHEY